MRGLRNRLIVSPGRVATVSGAGHTVPEQGDARLLVNRPPEGRSYRVEADTVQTTAARLAAIPVPTGRRYEHLTQIGLGPLPIYVPSPLAKLAKDLPEPLEGTDWGHAFRLAWHLSRGVKSELSVAGVPSCTW